MFTSLAITALLASSVLVRADPNPNSPGPGDIYNTGAQCPIGWAVDPTGVWKTMNIQLMTGDNLHMIPLTTVATVDGTSSTANTFSWTCPEVIPNSAIYFYQFTSPASNNTLWTTRFTIASATGATTPPTNSTQPDGKPIPWGTGALANPASANPPPGGSSSGSVSVPPATSSPPIPSVASLIVSSSLPPVSTPSSSRFTSTTTTGSASVPSGTTTGATGAAMTTLSVDGLIFKALIAIGVTAVGFTTVL